MSDPELREEVVGLARELIRIDTSNPPGNETPAAEHLATYLRSAGLECELTGPDPARLNLVARVAGSGEGPSLLLLAHTDVVPAPTAGWTVPPFEGVLREGRLIGRGAADMKNELAARAVALATFVRSGARSAGDLVLIAESDEERNTAGVGMPWLVRERSDLRCDFALNEGGGSLFELAGGGQIVTISTGEKQVSSLRLRFHGRGGHASVPARAENPLRPAASAVERLHRHRAPARILPSLAGGLESLGAPTDAEAAAAWAAAQHPVFGALLPPMMRMTITPTGLQTFEPSNVIPPFADVICDVRTLPGDGEEEIREQVELALGGTAGYDFELLEPLAGGTESPTGTALYRACEDYVAERLPGAVLFPALTPGFSDSHWVRKEHGTVAYGFAPVFHTDPATYMDTAHAADEAIEVADLVEMTRFHLHVLESW
jgi:acetylornithine deacetylase/succinyl-diaminopimelate desuccinylase-like protein